MAIFSSKAGTDGTPGKPTNGGRGSGDGAISIIGPGMRIVGDITTDGTVRVEGTVEGTLRAGKAVVLGKDGLVVGEVVTQDAVIGGRVTGTLVAESRLEMQATCSVDGTIRARTQHLLIHEGANFNGQIEMLDAERPVAADAAGKNRGGRGADKPAASTAT